MTKSLDVLYQSNDAYASVTAISMVSLLENNQHIALINIYYLNYEITADNQKKLKEVAARYANANLVMIDAAKYHNELVALGVESWRGIYVTWLKMLAFNDIPLSSGRLLFINGQTVVSGALDELIDFRFGDTIMALAYDCLLVDHKYTLGLGDADGYYNCGIMLINHDKWLHENTNEFVKESLRKKSNYLVVDQDFCNDVFGGRISLLPVEYNFTSAFYGYGVQQLIKASNLNKGPFYSFEEIMEVYYAPKIVHSLLGVTGKPWERRNDHPNNYLWKKYIDMNPWHMDSYPAATVTINWRLYKFLPRNIYMKLYRIAVEMKYGSGVRRNFLVSLLNKLTAQKGT